jgi:uncharacterized membrane protein HdeD (DUF308 family)
MTDQSQAAEVLRDWRGAFLAGGVTSLILGIVLLVWPSGTLVVIAALLGIGLILIGIGRLAGAAVDRAATGGHRALRALAGVVWIIAGIIVLANPHASLRAFAVIVALVWIIGGAAEVIAALTRGGDGRAASLVIGLLNVAFGVVLLLWPKPTVTVLLWLIGLWLILIGLIQLYLAYRAGRAARAVGPAIA